MIAQPQVQNRQRRLLPGLWHPSLFFGPPMGMDRRAGCFVESSPAPPF